MTDNEIIQALECCCDDCGKSCEVKHCPMIAECQTDINALEKSALALINRQKAEIDILIRKKETLRDEITEKDAEIDRLRHTNKLISKNAGSLLWHLEQAKSEAYREFADKVEKISKEVTVSYVADTSIQEHKTGMFYYRKEDFDNALNKLLSNDMGRYDHYTDSFVKELTESNE